MIKDVDPFKRSRNWWIVFWLLVLSLLTLRIYMGDMNATPKAQRGTVVAYYDNDYQKYAVEQLIKRQQIQEWYCLWSLWTKESNWNPKSRNHQSKAYGIPQIEPYILNLMHYKQSSNGYTQVLYGLAYIDRRYSGSPCKAYASSLARGWY
jgi:hypothetical protein